MISIESVEERLDQIAYLLDVPVEFRQEIEIFYDEITKHLGRVESKVGAFNPQLYPQGSFRIGTVVRPYPRKSDVDVDIVCTLELEKTDMTKKELRELVGYELRKFKNPGINIEPCGRCWRLNLSEHLHADILPAIPNPDDKPNGIFLTDRDLHHWQTSNPKGYADWFLEIARAESTALNEKLAKADIESFPEEERAKSRLQIAVQLLKRHRDVFFKTRLGLRPPSILITTLMALLNDHKSNIFEKLWRFAADPMNEIAYEGGKFVLSNPVSEGENFADKWNTDPARKIAFFEWHKQLGVDLREINESRSNECIDTIFEIQSLLEVDPITVSQTALKALGTNSVPAASSTMHAQHPSWPFTNKVYKAKVVGSIHANEKGHKLGPVTPRPIGKSRSLKFWVESNVPKPFDIYWQVINTGEEARQAQSGLRGKIETERPSPTKWETTSYRGTHFVLAYIVKDGVLMATTPRLAIRVN